MKTEKSCGCIILKNNKVLLIGAKDPDGEMFWSFPKGHQEPDETDIETAIRETKEETGLDVEIVDTNPIKTGHLVPGTDIYKDILLFVAKPLNDELNPQKEEAEQIEWAHIGEAGKRFVNYYNEAWEEYLRRAHKV